MVRRAELSPNSVAAIVLDPPEPDRPRPHSTDRPLPQGGIADIALGTTGAWRASQVGVGLVIGLGLHVGLAAAAMFWSADESRSARDAPAPLKVEHIVDLNPPAPEPPVQTPPVEEPPPREEPPVAEPPPRSEPVRAAVAARPTSPSPPPPAAAGQVVAAEPEAAEALDFTGFDIATGQGREYAGGVTASSGTNTRAVHSPFVDRKVRPGGSAGAGSRARPVGRPAADWSCPWPREAEALSIDEETVVLRVVVRPDGSVASADVVSDPGHGFGAVALACARGQRFPPARDESGNPITATSPPVRVHFTRSAR